MVRLIGKRVAEVIQKSISVSPEEGGGEGWHLSNTCSPLAVAISTHPPSHSNYHGDFRACACVCACHDNAIMNDKVTMHAHVHIYVCCVRVCVHVVIMG